MAAENSFVSIARATYRPIPALTAMGGIAELPLTPRLTRSQIVEGVRADMQRSGFVSPPAGQKEERVLPRPDWVPRLSWKTGAVALGVGLVVYFATR